MDLLQYNNKIIRLTAIDGQVFEGHCLYEDKDSYEEEEDGLGIKTTRYWYKIFESEIKSIEVLGD